MSQTKDPGDDVGHANPAALPTLGKTSSGSSKAKEQESVASLRKEEDKMMTEITSTADVIDREALAKARESFKEVKQAVPEVELKPDVEDAGVYSPQTAAENVVKNGPTIEVGTSENIYKKGLHQKVVGKVVGTAGNKVVIGVSSILAMAMWIGRLIKIAHKHTMRVVFRKDAVS